MKQDCLRDRSYGNSKQNLLYPLFSPVNEDINKAVVEVIPTKLDFPMLLDHAELGSEL